MSQELVQAVNLIANGGAFVLIAVIAVWLMFFAWPRSIEARKEQMEQWTAALVAQRESHSEERRYIRDVQERQHAENVESQRRMARAIAMLAGKRNKDHDNPDRSPDPT